MKDFTEESKNRLVYTESYILTAGESNARGEMPVTLIAERIIEVATRHANILGIGYANLSPLGVGWVLSRMSFRMTGIPKINQTYTVSTWIESWNRVFSERCFRFDDAEGNVLGYARTIWAVIDVNTRKASDLTGIGTDALVAREMTCPLPKMRNISPVNDYESETYTFRFTDLDFNRHVNSVRYIEHILNLWPLNHYDTFRVEGFEIIYRRECLAGQQVELRMTNKSTEEGCVDIVHSGERVVSAAIHFVKDPFHLSTKE